MKKIKIATLVLFLNSLFFLNISYHPVSSPPTAPKNDDPGFRGESLSAVLESLKSGQNPIDRFLDFTSLRLCSEANADGTGADPSCDLLTATAQTKCETAWSAYHHQALRFLNGTLCRMNNDLTARVEGTLCHFKKSMGVSVSFHNLPYKTTKTFLGKTIDLEVTAPMESWALTRGYQARASVKISGALYLLLWWGGSDKNTKGFMIEGPQNGSGGLGGLRTNYLTWDLTDDSKQMIKIYNAEFPSGNYLGTASKTGQSYRGDAAVYGSLLFNKYTKQVTAQSIIIEEQRSNYTGAGVTSGTPGQFGCFKMVATGSKGGTMTLAKNQNADVQTGDLLTNAHQYLENMDGVSLVDILYTPSNLGTVIPNQAGLESALGLSANQNQFDTSCANLSQAGANLFAGSAKVDFTQTVTGVFP